MPWNQRDYTKAIELSQDPSVDDEFKGKLRAKMQEYQAQHPESAALDTSGNTTGDRPDQIANMRDRLMAGGPVNVDPLAHATQAQQGIDEIGNGSVGDKRNFKLRNASKLDALYADPEYHPPADNPVTAFRNSIPSTFGGTVAHFYEPGWQTFQREVGPLLAERGIDLSGPPPDPKSHVYDARVDIFNAYKDARWIRFRKEAEINGYPAVRHEYVTRNNPLEKAGDAANTVVQEGVFPGVEAAANTAFLVPGVGHALGAAADAVAPGFYQDMVEGQERNPVTSEISSVLGMARPSSFGSRAMTSLNQALGTEGRGLAGRLASTGLASGLTNVAQGAGEDAQRALAQASTGAPGGEINPLDNAEARLIAGTLFGAGSELLGSAAGGIRGAYRSGERGRGIAIAEAGGGETDPFKGFKVSPEVKAFTDRGGPDTAVEAATAKAVPKVVGGASKVDAEMRQRQSLDNAASLGSPSGLEFFEPKQLSNALVGELQAVRDPYGAPIAWTRSPAARDVVNKVIEPVLVPAESSQQVSADTGYPNVSIEDAKSFGLDLNSARRSITGGRAPTAVETSNPDATTPTGAPATALDQEAPQQAYGGSSSNMRVLLRARPIDTPTLETMIDTLGSHAQSSAKIKSPEASAYGRLHAAAIASRPSFDTLRWAPGVEGTDKFYTPSLKYNELKQSQAQEQKGLERDLGHANIRREAPGKTVGQFEDMGADQQNAAHNAVSQYGQPSTNQAMADRALERFAKQEGGLEDLKRVAATREGAKLLQMANPIRAAHGSVGGFGGAVRFSDRLIDPVMLRLDKPLSSLATPAFEPAVSPQALGVTPKLMLLLRSMRQAPAPTGSPLAGAFSARGGFLGQRAAASMTQEDLNNLRSLLARFGDKLSGNEATP